MNPDIYREYCSHIIDLCEFAVIKHSELVNSSNIANILDELEKIKNFIEEFLNETKSIYFLGESSSGKSTFINHIFGDKLIPQSTKIETRVISKIHNSENKSIEIKFKDSIDKLDIDSELKENIIQILHKESNEFKLNICENYELELYKKLVKSNNNSDKNNDANKFINEVNFYHPFTRFKNFVFYDTPGVFSAKNDTDDDVLKAMFSKFSSYVFFLFDAGEPAQSKIRKQIENYKNVLSMVKNKRLIFLGTHLDNLEHTLKTESKNMDFKLSVEKYKSDLREFLDDLEIEYLDIFLLSLTSKNPDNINYAPLDLKNKVTLGEIEHKINMHSYELNNYFLQLVVNEPGRFVNEYILNSFSKKLSDNDKKIEEINTEILKQKSKYDKQVTEINTHAHKAYFDEFLVGLEKAITKLLTEEESYFNDNIDKIENYVNKYKSSIHTEINIDHGGENCKYFSIKEKVKSQISNYEIDLSDHKLKWFRKIFTKYSTRKEPFQKRTNSDVFKEFMNIFNKTKIDCEKIIKQHYDGVELSYKIEYNNIKLKLENDLNIYKSEVEKINTIKLEIEKKEEKCIKSLKEIEEKLNKRNNEKQNNPLLRFLNEYRISKQINN